MATIGADSSAAHSVYTIGGGGMNSKFAPPAFELLSKPTTTVDVGRLQLELRALHGRLALLEQAALDAAAAASEGAYEPPADTDKPSSGPSGSIGATTYEETVESGGDRKGYGDVGHVVVDVPVGDRELVTTAETRETERLLEEGVSSFDQSRNKSKKKAASAAAAMQAELQELSERVESLAATGRRREKAQASKEKASALARSMEMNRVQLAIESRVTSDELEQAVGANADKITALQSSVDTALSDRFRRMQDMVHSQMAGLLQMVQVLQQQQPRERGGSKLLRGSYAPAKNKFTAGTAKLTSESDDSDSDGDNNFVSAVTDVVQRLQREKEAQEGGRRSGGVTSDMFEALQEDYEIFKGQMEEKADRQDGMASAIEDAQARLEEAEANIVHLTEETETSGQDVQEALELANTHRSELKERVKATSALAADAHAECAATRSLVSESRRDGLSEARKEAEAIAARAEGRVKAEVQAVRGDARTASENLSMRLKRLDKRIADELEVQKAAISASKELSDKAVASAKAAGGRAAENDAALERTEGRIAGRLDEIIQTQTNYTDEILERVAAGEAELCRARDEIEHLVNGNRGEITTLKDEHAKLTESVKRATEELRSDVQDTLAMMVTDNDLESDASCAGDFGGGCGGIHSRGGERRISQGPSLSCSRNNSNGAGPHSTKLWDLGASLRRQGDGVAQQVVTLQRSGVGIVTVMRKLEAGLHALSTKDLFWQAVDAKLMAHQRSVGDVCLSVEDSTIQRRRKLTLPKEAQACLAGDMQRVGKLIATKADYEVIRELAKLEGPEQTGHDWDDRIELVGGLDHSKTLPT